MVGERGGEEAGRVEKETGVGMETGKEEHGPEVGRVDKENGGHSGRA